MPKQLKKKRGNRRASQFTNIGVAVDKSPRSKKQKVNRRASQFVNAGVAVDTKSKKNKVSRRASQLVNTGGSVDEMRYIGAVRTSVDVSCRYIAAVRNACM